MNKLRYLDGLPIERILDIGDDLKLILLGKEQNKLEAYTLENAKESYKNIHLNL